MKKEKNMTPLTSVDRKQASERYYDVVIYGGSSAAVTAAIQVRRMGRRAAIVCPDSQPGGLTISGLGATDSGNRTVIGGLARDFYHRVWQHYRREDAWTFQARPNSDGMKVQGLRGIDDDTETMWIFEPHVASKIMNELLTENEIDVFADEEPDFRSIIKEGPVIRSFRTNSGKTFGAAMFLDASYEGDLMAAAGAEYTIGREGNDQYSETLNGVQTQNATHHQFAGFVDPYIVPGNPSSGLLPGIEERLHEADGNADSKIQAYNYRLCLTNVARNRVDVEKPDGYRELDYELLFRSIEAGQKIFFDHAPMPNCKSDTNNNQAVSTDWIGGNYHWPTATFSERREIALQHKRWCQGLLWTLSHHPRVPQDIREECSQWGPARDEFVSTGNWPPSLYVREGRRMLGVFVMTELHLRNRLPVPHPIAMGSYNMDSHNVQRYVDYTMFDRPTVRNEGDVQVNPGGPYRIDYGSILPQSSDVTNLLVPVCVACSHIAYGSIRMEPVFMILGQSAATAAILALEQKTSPQKLDYSILEKRLLEDQQIL